MLEIMKTDDAICGFFSIFLMFLFELGRISAEKFCAATVIFKIFPKYLHNYLGEKWMSAKNSNKFDKLVYISLRL